MSNISLTIFNKTSVILDLISNKMFIRYLNNWKSFLLSEVTFFKALFKNKNYNNCIIVSLFFKNKQRYYRSFCFFQFFYFLTKLNLNENSLQVGFYRQLDLIGLGFRIVKLTQKLFFFELGWASGVYFFVPKYLKVLISSKKKKILIFGHNVHKVMNMVSSLVLLRRMNPYRIGGFMQYKSIIRLRTGKQR